MFLWVTVGVGVANPIGQRVNDLVVKRHKLGRAPIVAIRLDFPTHNGCNLVLVVRRMDRLDPPVQQPWSLQLNGAASDPLT
jgi:hypothetical protein